MRNRYFAKKIIAFLLCLALIGTANVTWPFFHTNAEHRLGSSHGLGHSGDGNPLPGEAASEDIAAAAPEGWNIIDSHTVEVSSYDGLVDALADVRYTHIYFANDIAPAAPVRLATINSQKTEQYIFGRAYHNADEIFTFTQPDSSDVGYTIRVVSGSATTHVTVADMAVAGRNYYGIVQVPDGHAGVTTRYENITYTGPQPVHNRSGTVQFADVKITLTYGNGYNTGEVAEAYNIEFEGDNTIDTDLSSNGHHVFHMTRINSVGGKFRVLPDASVHITTPSMLFYTGGTEEGSPELLFGQDSSFYAYCGQGFTPQMVNEVDIAPGASVKLVQSASTSDGYALRVRNKLMVREGAVFELLRPKGGTAAVQMHSAGTVAFHNPERVVIYASSGLLFAGVGGSNIDIHTDALNLWQTADGGSSAEEPTQIWNKHGKNRTLTVNLSWSATNVVGSVSSNLDPEEDPVLTEINTATFAVRNSHLLVLGRIGLTINEIPQGAAEVTGVTEPSALLTGSYTTVSNAAGTISGGAADEEGRYRLSLEGESPLPGSRVYVTAYSDRLRMRQYPYEIEAEPVLEFVSVPDIVFETIKIPTSTTYVRRADPNWAITVRDTRKESPGFRVQASVKAPMTATLDGDTYTIPDGLVYVHSGGAHRPLSDEPLTVYSDHSGVEGDHVVRWDDAQGLLMRVGPGDDLLAGTPYSATIYWALVDAP